MPSARQAARQALIAQFPQLLAHETCVYCHSYDTGWRRGDTGRLIEVSDVNAGLAVIVVDTRVHHYPRDAVQTYGSPQTVLSGDIRWRTLPDGMRWGGLFYPVIVNDRTDYELVNDQVYGNPYDALLVSREAQNPSYGQHCFFLLNRAGVPSYMRGLRHELTGVRRQNGMTILCPPPEVPTRRCSRCRQGGHNSASCQNLPAIIDKVGIEIEGLWTETGSRRVRTAASQWHMGISGDGSIHTRGCSRGLYANEFQTAPGYVEAALAQLVAGYPDEVNESCGMHVHVSFLDPTVITQLMTPEFFAYFRRRWLEWGERTGLHPDCEFYSRLEGENQYCRPNDNRTITDNAHHDRYFQLNFSAWHEHKTVECRLLPMFQHAAIGVSAVKELLSIYHDWVTDAASEPAYADSRLHAIPSITPNVEAIEIDVPAPASLVAALEVTASTPPPVTPGHRRIILTPNTPEQVRQFIQSVASAA